MSVIDIHSHFIPEKYLEAISISENAYNENLSIVDGKKVITVQSGMKYILVDELYKLDSILAEMDEAGIDISVLSAPPTLFHYQLTPDQGKHYAEMINNGIAEAVASNSKRFVGMAYVPLQDGQIAANELNRCVKELNMKSVHICSNVRGKNLDDSDLEPFFAKAEELQTLILVHPWEVAGIDRMRKYHLANAIGNPMDTTIAIGSLIFGGVLEKYPDLRICFSHAGGAAPFIIGRMNRAHYIRPECKGVISKPPSEYLKMLYFDTIAHWDDALEYLIKSVGSDKVLLGSDFPFQLFDMGDPNPVQSVNNINSLTESDRKKILGANAATLLGL